MVNFQQVLTVLPDVHKNLLYYILCSFVGSRHLKGHGIKAVFVNIEQLPECRFIAGSDLGKQRSFIIL